MTVCISRGSPVWPYWRAIPEDERERIEAAVPDGHRLVISTGYRGKPGTGTVELRDNQNRTVRGSRGYVNAARCWSAVGPSVVVTTDGAGFITSIEDE